VHLRSFKDLNFNAVKRSRLHQYALFVAFWTLLLVMSGAAVTSSRDLPRQAPFQNIHLVVGTIDIVLLVGLSIWRAGWIVLAVAGVDAALGWYGAVGPVTGTLHAFLAALLFAAVAAISRRTSHSWQCDPELVRDYGRPSLRFLSSAAAILVAAQVAFGAGFRHSAVGVLPHLLGALVVALFIVIVGAFVTTQFPKHASLRRMAVALMTITAIQVFLGLTAFLMRLMNMAGTTVFLGISVAHVATGSLTFAVSVMLAMEIRRCVLPRAVVSGGTV
jgi:heme A synthase